MGKDNCCKDETESIAKLTMQGIVGLVFLMLAPVTAAVFIGFAAKLFIILFNLGYNFI